MTRTIFALLASLMLATATGAIEGEEAQSASQEGFSVSPYIGLKIGAAFGTVPSLVEDADHGELGVISAFAGLEFSEYIGAELGFTQFGERGVSNSAGSVDVDASTFYLAGKASLPLGMDFPRRGMLFAKLGIHFPDVSGTIDAFGRSTGYDPESEPSLVYGVGAEYMAFPSLEMSIGVEWTRYEFKLKDYEDSDTDSIMLTLKKNF